MNKILLADHYIKKTFSSTKITYIIFIYIIQIIDFRK